MNSKFKKIVSIAACTAVLLSAVSVNAKTVQFTMNDTNAKILQAEIENATLLCAPYTKSDRTLIPVRFVSENFGAEVNWDEDTKTVTIQKDGKTITLQIGSLTAYDNGTPVTLDTAPEQTNFVTMVPVRFVTETLGYTVNYSEMGEKVLVSDEKPLFTVNGRNVMPTEFKTFCDLMAAQYNITPDKEFVDYMYNSFKMYCVISNASEIKQNEQVLNNINENRDFIKGQISTLTKELGADTLDGTVELMFDNINNATVYRDWLQNEEYNKLTDEDIEKAYKENYICAKHILISNTNENESKTVDEVLKKIKANADFDKLVEEYGEDPGMKSNPDGYVFTKGEMVQEFENAAFALKEGEISEPVKTTYGTHIIKRIALPDADDSIKENVKQTLSAINTNDIISKMYNNADISDNYTAEETENYIINK